MQVQIQFKFCEIIKPKSIWWREGDGQTEQVQHSEANGGGDVGEMDVNTEVNKANSTLESLVTACCDFTGVGWLWLTNTNHTIPPLFICVEVSRYFVH